MAAIMAALKNNMGDQNDAPHNKIVTKIRKTRTKIDKRADDGSQITFEEPSTLVAPPASHRRSSRASTDSSFSDTARRASNLFGRRRSSFRGLANTVNFMRRLSIGRSLKEKDEEKKEKLQYENTYRLEPDQTGKFQCNKVRETVTRILQTYLRDEKYDEKRCRQLATDLTTVIKNSVKELNFKRYKIVCSVILGEKRGQGIEATGRCCWNEKTDSYVVVEYENASLFAVCSVHGVYFE